MIDVSIFPPQYHTQIKSLLYDLEISNRQYTSAYAYWSNLILSKNSPTQEIDNKTFDVIEKYRNNLDCISSYTNYLNRNDLMKYLLNGET